MCYLDCFLQEYVRFEAFKCWNLESYFSVRANQLNGCILLLIDTAVYTLLRILCCTYIAVHTLHSRIL